MEINTITNHIKNKKKVIVLIFINLFLLFLPFINWSFYNYMESHSSCKQWQSICLKESKSWWDVGPQCDLWKKRYFCNWNQLIKICLIFTILLIPFLLSLYYLVKKLIKNNKDTYDLDNMGSLKQNNYKNVKKTIYSIYLLIILYLFIIFVNKLYTLYLMSGITKDSTKYFFYNMKHILNFWIDINSAELSLSNAMYYGRSETTPIVYWYIIFIFIILFFIISLYYIWKNLFNDISTKQ